MKALPGSFSLAYKKRTYSPNRIKYPLKRVDWDPERRAEHAEPRQEQVRAHLLGRSHRHHRQRDQADPQELRPARHPRAGRWPRRVQDHPHAARPPGPPARHDGRLHPAGPQPGQLGRLVLGRQARLGPGLPGHDVAGRQPRQGHLRELRHGALLGLRPGDHPLGLHRPVRQPHLLLLDAGRHQAGLHLPRPELRRRRPRRQMDPGPAQHRCRPAAGHHLYVDQRRHLGQGICRDPRGGHGQGRGLCPGQGRRHSQDAGMGLQEVRRAGMDDQGPGQRVRQESHLHHPLLRRLAWSAARTRTSPAGWNASCWACRAWADPASISAR